MKKVIISINSGIVEVEKIPKDVELIVKDYDIEGMNLEKSEVKEDVHGEFVESHY